MLCQVGNGKVLIPTQNVDRQPKRISKGSVLAHGRMIDDLEIYKLEPLVEEGADAHVNQLNTAKEIKAKDITVDDKVPKRFLDELLGMLDEFQDITAESIDELGTTSISVCRIGEIPGSAPIRSRPFTLSLMERDALREIIAKMLKAGIIRGSTSPYASPAMLVKKKDGSWRMVIDYRRSNNQTKKVNFPIPLIDDILDAVGRRNIYSTIDLAWGYFQKPMAPGSEEKAEFITRDRHDESIIMQNADGYREWTWHFPRTHVTRAEYGWQELGVSLH